MRAAIYRRVSSRQQATDDHFSLAEQEEKTRRYCHDKGYEVIADLEDIHTGADLEERPKMSELREMMRMRQIDVVVLATVDRISRNQLHQAVILHDMEKYGIRMELTEEVFEDSPNGALLRSMAGYFAEMERQKIRDRTIRGKQQRVRQGLMVPGNIPLYGYSWADDRKSQYVINPRTAPIAQRIWNEAAVGKPIRRIAIDLTIDGIDCPKDAWRRQKNDPNDPPRGSAWIGSTIDVILHNPAYWGEHSAFRWSRTRAPGDRDPITGIAKKVTVLKEREVGDVRVPLPDAAPALVSTEMARAVHARLAKNKELASRRNKHPEQTLLRGYVYCSGCCKKLAVSYNDHGTVYRCQSACLGARSVQRCQMTNAISAQVVDTEVWEGVMTILLDPEYFEKEMRELIDNDGREDALEAIRKRIQDLDSQQANIARVARYMGDESGAERLAANLKAIARERQASQSELERLEQDSFDREAAREQLKAVKIMLHGIIQAGKVFTYEEKRAMLYMLNIKVVVFPKDAIPRYEVTGGKHGEMRLPIGGYNSVRTAVLSPNTPACR